MRAEALEAPQAVARLLAADAERYAALAGDLRHDESRAWVTVARGSSDHAAQFMAYLVMSRLGHLVTSLPLSIVTLHAAPLRCDGLVAFAFSQSGRSPDLVAPMQFFRARAARTVAFVNAVDSPLAGASQWVLPLHAGPETSVAATKSCIAQFVAGARLVAECDPGSALRAALHGLPDRLDAATRADWSAAIQVLSGATQLFVVGRGSGLAVAMEAALKLKETCGIQAEGVSGAELAHGPMALVGPDYPVLVLAPRGPAQAGLLVLAETLRQRGARVLLAAPPGTPDAQLQLVVADDAVLDAVTALLSFYLLAESLARSRGLDPDAPRHLSKVTLTI